MNVRTQFSPPDSNTAPDSRVQINSKTCHKIKDVKCFSLFLFSRHKTIHTLFEGNFTYGTKKIKSTIKSEFFKSLSNLLQIYLLKFLFPHHCLKFKVFILNKIKGH